MKKYISIILLAILFSSCELGMERVETGSDNQESVFSDKDKTRQALNYLYDCIRFTNALRTFNENTTYLYMDCATDNGRPTLINFGVFSFNMSQLKPGQNPFSDGHNPWIDYYTAIRMANIFLQNIDVSPLTIEEKEDMKVEARFLRAVYYAELFKCYGGLILLGDEVVNELSFGEWSRSSIEETVEYIVSELDAVTPLLKNKEEWDATDLGRATQGMAMAYKARTLILYASPLNTQGVSDSEKKTRWEEAAQANLDLITEGSYDLHPNYEELFYQRVSPEHIVTDYVSRGTMAWLVLPQTFQKTGNIPGMRPTFNLVDGYAMKDGKSPILGYDANNLPIFNDEVTNYDDNNPFVNRDPRLNMNVFKHGDQIFYNRKWQTVDMLNQEAGNLAALNSLYVRKYIKVDHDFWYNGGIDQNYTIIRFAEILLNYAEAVNESDGPTVNALQAINRVRLRAGADPLSEIPSDWTQEELREQLYVERRMEFFGEDQRFWDARRWLKAQKWFTGPVFGGMVDQNGKYSRFIIENRLFLPKMYRLPILPKDVVGSNGKITQNPGW